MTDDTFTDRLWVMTKTPTLRILAPQEAQGYLDLDLYDFHDQVAVDALHTVATEPERIAAAERAAVVKALNELWRDFSMSGERRSAETLRVRRDAIENGAPL